MIRQEVTLNVGVASPRELGRRRKDDKMRIKTQVTR